MLEVMNALLLEPLSVIYSFCFETVFGWLSPGFALLAFALLLNLMLMPVYYQMEQRFRSQRELRERVSREVERMKRHFRGRERYFYIRAVYRQFDYRPISALFGSADLLIQVLVFATVYRYLLGLDVLVGERFGPIHDLSRADGLLAGVNALPLLMTVINAASVLVYVEDRAKRVQALLLATLFLVLLYDSASGLVLYWTMNNLFSLSRNLLQRRVLSRLPRELFSSVQRLAQQQ